MKSGAERHGGLNVGILDNPTRRLPLVVFASVLCWAGLLALFGMLIDLQFKPRPEPMEIKASVIELPAAGLAGGGGGSSPAIPQTAAPKAVEKPAVQVRKTKTQPHRLSHVATHEPVASIAEPQPQKKTESAPIVETSNAASNNRRETASSIPADGDAFSAANHGRGGGTGNGSGNGKNDGAGAGSGGGFGAGGTGPSAIYAPVPTIPEELRSEVMEATAVARFRVFRNGRADVVLSAPTEFSELNDIILDTLRKWRFRPATNHGEAVDSDAEVRLRITVQ